jgi:hypothetical protein
MSKIKNSILMELKCVGHIPHIQVPDVSKRVLRFLRSEDEPGTLRSAIKFVVRFDFINKIFQYYPPKNNLKV